MIFERCVVIFWFKWAYGKKTVSCIGGRMLQVIIMPSQLTKPVECYLPVEEPTAIDTADLNHVNNANNVFAIKLSTVLYHFYGIF